MRKTIDSATLWSEVPTEFIELARPVLDSVAEDMIEAIQHDIPEYARPLDHFYTRCIRLAVDQALRQFIEHIANPNSPWEPITGVYSDIGRGEAQEGRSLDALQTAMRLGARVAWRRLCDAARRLDMPMETLAGLGEAIFAYLEQIASASADGYLEEQAKAAGEFNRRRQRLLDLVLTEPPASPDEIAAVAREAKWRLPATVAPVALVEHTRNDSTFLSLPPDVLIDVHHREPRLLVPDPDGPGRTEMIANALRRHWTAAIGPTVPLAEAPTSFRWARQTLELKRRGIICDGGVIRSADHIPTLVLFQDEKLVQALAASRLQPLSHARPTQQHRLAETLLAWLQCGGNATEVAARLHLHPQTVRYRLRQLDQLFGGLPTSPDERFELEITLRARQRTALARAASRPQRLGRVIPLKATNAVN